MSGLQNDPGVSDHELHPRLPARREEDDVAGWQGYRAEPDGSVGPTAVRFIPCHTDGLPVAA